MAHEQSTDGTEGVHDETTEPTVSIASNLTPSTPPSPAALPAAIPAPKQLGMYKKCAFVDTEDSSEEEDVNMDINSNNSSSSSVASDHVPTKHLRTSTITTRRSGPASGGTTADPSNCGFPSVDNSSTSLNLFIAATNSEIDPRAATEPETELETGAEADAEPNTEPETKISGHTNILLNPHVNPTKRTIADAQRPVGTNCHNLRPHLTWLLR